MGGGNYILVGKEPCLEPDLMVWARWFEVADRQVALTEVRPGVRVSTVFLGLDHSFFDGPPILFETMVFGGGDAITDGGRYSTWAEAEVGHMEIVEKLMPIEVS